MAKLKSKWKELESRVEELEERCENLNKRYNRIAGILAGFLERENRIINYELKYREHQAKNKEGLGSIIPRQEDKGTEG